jgi:PIN domain nuclease of toxin-antitoxin system
MIHGGTVTSYCIDAHALIWHLEGNPNLGSAARAVLDSPDVSLILPTVALAEALRVIQRGKARLPSWTDVLESIKSDPRIEIVPLTAAIVARAMALPIPFEMHDGQIVATALEYTSSSREIVLLTRDRQITQSGLVTVSW